MRRAARTLARAAAHAVAPGAAPPGAGAVAWAGAARRLSNLPLDTVYGGPSPASPKRVTLRTLDAMYRRGEPISMVTAYDYPSAVHVRAARAAWRGVGARGAGRAR